jgi:hypothetical protein
MHRNIILDNSRVQTLVGPEQHSVHCLVDVRSCVRTAYELLLPPEPGQIRYARGWRLDSDTKDRVLELARTNGRCQTCDEGYSNPEDQDRGFHVAISATVLDMGSSTVPPTISGELIVSTPPDNLFCGSGQTIDMDGNIMNMTDANSTNSNITNTFFAGNETARPPTRITTSGSDLTKKYNAHASLMLIGWGWLLPSGTLFARFFKHRPHSLWFQIHRVLQSVGLLFSIVGWIIALRNFNVFQDKGYDSYKHGVLGMVTMILGCLQPLNAFLRPHPPTREENEKSTARLVWELVHKSTGYIAILLAIVTIGYGTTILPDLDQQKTFQMAYGLGCGGMLAVLFLALQTDRIFYKRNNETQEDEKAASSGEKQTMVMADDTTTLTGEKQTMVADDDL